MLDFGWLVIVYLYWQVNVLKLNITTSVMKKSKQYKATCFTGLLLLTVFMGSSGLSQVISDPDRHYAWLKSSQMIKPQQDSMVSESYDTITGLWIAEKKHAYAYDLNNNNIQCIISDWQNTTSQWIQDTKSEYTHDENGNVILFIITGTEVQANGGPIIKLFIPMMLMEM